MEKFELSIPYDFIEDFTIYYVGSDGLNEINTSKDENKITNEITERNKLTKNLEKEIKEIKSIKIQILLKRLMQKQVTGRMISQFFRNKLTKEQQI